MLIFILCDITDPQSRSQYVHLTFVTVLRRPIDFHERRHGSYG